MEQIPDSGGEQAAMKERAEHLIQEGVIACQQGDINLGEAHFREALRLSPTDTDGLFNLGVACYAKRDFDSAMDLLSQCIAADPARPKAYYQRGMVRHAKGDLNGALADFDTELRSDPDDVEAILSRGATLSALGNKGEALASYQRAIQLAPHDPRPHFNRGLLRNESDPEGALADFSAAIACDPRKADAYMARGFLLRAKGRKKEALADFHAFFQLDGPRLYGNADLVRGWIHELERETGGATPKTPISDLMADYIESQTQESFARFLEAFRRARVGVIASGAPEGTTGDFTSTSKHPLSVGLSKDNDGHPVVLAFADPPAFARNFGGRFNAEMSGEAVLKTVLLNPECRGARVNSAKAEVSILIARHSAASLLGSSNTAPASSRRPWWKVW
jgi:tetratricopeptide (TPR) repeat protein